MKIFFTYQGEENKFFFSLDVSESSTVGEILELPKIKNVLDSITHKIIIGVNGEILDGTFKPTPERYRLTEGNIFLIKRAKSLFLLGFLNSLRTKHTLSPGKRKNFCDYFNFNYSCYDRGIINGW